MMVVSRRLQQADEVGAMSELLDQARRRAVPRPVQLQLLARRFGGIYLPHLRNAIYNHLIAADNLLDRRRPAARRTWVEATAGDFNFEPAGSPAGQRPL